MEKKTLGCTLHLLVILICAAILFAAGCNKDEPFPLPKPGKRITQTYTIHDDNVNGVVLRTQNNITIREITNFYYNSYGLLDSLNAFDSTNTVMVKSLKLQYMDGKIRGYFFDFIAGRYTLDFHYNENFELTKVTDVVGLGWGIFLNYSNSRIIQGDLTLGTTTSSLSNLVYDSGNNLLQYVVSDSTSTPVIKVELEYDHTKEIPEYLDIKFAGVGLRYLYAGGVNVISLMGLNYGNGNTNWVTKRTETDMQTSEVTREFLESFSVNSNNEIVGKTVTLNDTIDIFYEYHY